MDNNEEMEAKQYIVVKIGNEQYGISIQYVNNIVRMQKITRVPKAQNYFKGVINLRGDIIPVMSLRLRFDLAPDEYTGKTRILILKVEQASIGILVDEVREVVTVNPEEVEKISYDDDDDRLTYLAGIAKHNDSLISLLNITGVIMEKEKEKEA